MEIKLIFDYYSKTISIPDFYTDDILTLQEKFLAWASEQKKCVSFYNGHIALSYDADDFFEFINVEILKDSKFKAYFIADKKEQKNISIRF